MGQSLMTGESHLDEDSSGIFDQEGSNNNPPDPQLSRTDSFLNEELLETTLSTRQSGISNLDIEIHRKNDTKSLIWSAEHFSSAQETEGERKELMDQNQIKKDQIEIIEYTIPNPLAVNKKVSNEFIMNKDSTNSQITFVNVKEPVPQQIAGNELAIMYKIAAMSKKFSETNEYEVESQNNISLDLNKSAETDLSPVVANQESDVDHAATKELVVLRNNEFFSENSSMEQNTSDVDLTFDDVEETISKDINSENTVEKINRNNEFPQEIQLTSKKVMNGTGKVPYVCIKEDQNSTQNQEKLVTEKVNKRSTGLTVKNSVKSLSKTSSSLLLGSRLNSGKTGSKTYAGLKFRSGQYSTTGIKKSRNVKESDLSILVLQNKISTLLTVQNQKANIVNKWRKLNDRNEQMGREISIKSAEIDRLSKRNEGSIAKFSQNESLSDLALTENSNPSGKNYVQIDNRNSLIDETRASGTRLARLNGLEREISILRLKLNESQEKCKNYEKSTMALRTTLKDTGEKLTYKIHF